MYMKKMSVYPLLFGVVAAIVLGGCNHKPITTARPSATGSIYEMLIVMDNAYWEGKEGDSVRSCMGADMPCLPQMEAYFTLSQVSTKVFDNLLKPTRNILFIDINPERYTHNKILFSKDVYSYPQAFCRIQSPSADEFSKCFDEYKVRVRSWFVRQELERQSKFYRSSQNTQAVAAIKKEFDCDMLVPIEYQLVIDTADFVWAVSDKGSMRRDLIVYSYPYTDANTFTRDYLLQKRDSLVKSRIGGSLAGSYMGTEYKHIVPIYTPLRIDDAYCAEIRGLWKMYNGASMGGPFVQHTRLDEVHQRVITAEVFIFASGQKKRNALRQSEAILYTWHFPKDTVGN